MRRIIESYELCRVSYEVDFDANLEQSHTDGNIDTIINVESQPSPDYVRVNGRPLTDDLFDEHGDYRGKD